MDEYWIIDIWLSNLPEVAFTVYFEVAISGLFSG